MSLSSLSSTIYSLKHLTRNLSDESLGDYNWRQRFMRMLDELDRTLKDMDNRIDHIESKLRRLK